jgi:hypothetical protein
MHWLKVYLGLGLLSCSLVASPSHTEEVARTIPTTQQGSKPPQGPTSSPAASLASNPVSSAPLPLIIREGALFSGTVLRVVAFAPEDPLSKEASSLIGLFCVVGEGGLFLGEDGYAEGEAVCGSKTVLTRFTRAMLSIVYQTQKKQPNPDPAVACMSDSVSVGRAFTIHAIGGGDAYFKRAKELLGLSCVVTRELKSLGDGWFSGTARCGLPAEYMFFSEVSVEVK